MIEQRFFFFLIYLLCTAITGSIFLFNSLRLGSYPKPVILKYGLWTSSISFTWKLLGSTSDLLNQKVWEWYPVNLFFNKLSKWFCFTLKFKNVWLRQIKSRYMKWSLSKCITSGNSNVQPTLRLLPWIKGTQYQFFISHTWPWSPFPDSCSFPGKIISNWTDFGVYSWFYFWPWLDFMF